jgi:hypothetical protein
MPCAITSGADYPNYLKNAIKRINAGNDTYAKTCVCSLKSPVDNDGCTILDEDGKIGAFPFCVINTDSDPLLLISNGYPAYTRFTLKQLMELWWAPYNYSINASGFWSFGPINCGAPIEDVRIVTHSLTARGPSSRDNVSIENFLKQTCDSPAYYEVIYTFEGQDANNDNCDVPVIDPWTPEVGLYIDSEYPVYFYQGNFYIILYYLDGIAGGVPRTFVGPPGIVVGKFRFVSLSVDMIGGDNQISNCTITRNGLK